MIEEINELLKDMWNNELSKTGKFNLEQQMRKLLKYKDLWEELFDFYENKVKDMYNKNDVMVLGRLKDLKQKYNLGGE